MWSLFSIVQHFTAYWVILDITLPTLSLTEYLWHTLLVCGLKTRFNSFRVFFRVLHDNYTYYYYSCCCFLIVLTCVFFLHLFVKC